MPDLHGWITQQIDTTEGAALAAAALCGCHEPAPSWSFGDEATDGRILIVGDPHPGLKRKIGRRWNGSYEGLFTAQHIVRHDPAAVLRRCEADRRILARHNVDPTRAGSPWTATACEGCGTFGDCDDPYVENLNDCPELLDLGHAHGLTPEILASLDRPVPPPMPERPKSSPGLLIPAAIYEPIMRVALADVPPTLRGPNWKPAP